MKLSRESAVKINFFLDQFIPPIIRDSELFMNILLRMISKGKSHVYKDFKVKAFNMSERDFNNVYGEVEHVHMKRETHLNNMCMNEILKHLKGPKVLDAGCGNGYLAGKISKKYHVTASDIIIDPDLERLYPHITFIRANIERLPFIDQEFDTVVCTHTLEHMRDIWSTIDELRRVTKKRLIIVVPKQRPYRYTFDLHLHFFPYEHSLLAIMGPERKNSCRTVGGDLFYIEDV